MRDKYRKTVLASGAILIALLVLLVAQFLFLPGLIWSKTVSVPVRETKSDACVIHAVEGLPNILVDGESRVPADDLYLTTDLRTYEVRVLIKHPSATTVAVLAYGPGSLFLKPWLTQGAISATIRSLSDRISTSCG